MLPFLLLILVGVVDLGRVYFSYMTIVNAAREGARYGAEYPTDSNGITSHAQNEADGTIVLPAQLTVTTNCPCTQENPITVTVQTNFQLITTLIFGGGAIPLKASNAMVVFGQ